ncbi:hypothetical protein PF008_g4217 [Phytophthora fragariae]|uniref:Uncharacterized protein n=1 Tax=Phytophthora fragariae TaxID=53985 RepID=A0A6G0SDV9_9STRA|nr:hypothetical protein PF008_g4217 [Phytophthora fragariae]
MLQSPSSRDFRRFVADTCKLNLIDVLWWEVLTVDQDVETENRELRALWYALLTELCCSRAIALEIMSKRFLEEFILHGYEHQLEDERLQQLLCLVSSVIRVTSTSDHGQFFAKDHATMEILAELCIRTVVSISDMNDPKWNATEVLCALTMHEQTLLAVGKVCYLFPMEQFDYDSIARRSRLLAVSEMLLQCENAIADLVCVLTLVLKICESKQNISTLVHARNAPDCWPMTDVLIEVLQQCIGSATDSANRYLRPIVLTTTRPEDFLPYELPTELHTQATVLTLRLVHLCVGDYHFAQSLETDMELVPQLVACLASSNWEVAGAAAAALSTLIRCVPDWNDSLDNSFGSVTRYMCDQGVYRWLDYFSTMDTQVMCRLSPPSMFPSSFVLLLRWLRFYSVNLSLLSDFQPVEFQPGHPNSSDLHVKLVADILELLLYIVSNFHSEIYKNDNSEAEENEHAIFLQSLLALCQRRSQSQPDAKLGSENDTCIVLSSQIRSRSLELVQLLCSLDLPRTSSVEVFANSRQMLILMMMVERSASEIEQSAAAQLIEELALKDVIKDLLIRNTTLLSRLGAWLEIEALQLLAAAIFQRLATPSSKGSRSARQSVFGFSPSAQQQLAHFLFVGLGQRNKNLDDLPSHSALLLKNVRRINVAVTQQEENGRSSPVDSPLVVHLKFEVVLKSGLCIREFEYAVKFHSGSGSSSHEFLVEQPVGMIRCTVTACSSVGGGDSTETKFELVPGFGSFVHYSDFVTLRISENPSAQSPSTRGVLSRLLRQETDALSLELFDALSSIVTEFCKDFLIFCDPVIDLPEQILFVLATSATFSPDGKMDTACLEALRTWFPSKPTISSLKSSVSPLWRLIQSLRQLPCIGDDVVEVKQIISRDNYVPTSTQFTFLETFVELIASVEAGEYSANCLNILFMENSDLLLYLCAQFKPIQSSYATFLALVAIAIRGEVVHCQSFTTRSAQNLLQSVFDAGIRESAGQSEQEQGELICFAASVAVRLARCPGIDRNSVNGADSLQYFSRVAFELFARHQWVDCFPTEAAKYLILACGFFCDGLLKSVAVDADTRESERFAALFTSFDVLDNGLTIVETLLMFLGQPSRNDQGTGDGQVAFDSVDRLAASVLASLVEKLPSRAKLELTLLELLDRRSNTLTKTPQINGKHFEEQCLMGIRKCIGLTRYDFQSELHAVQLTYYSCIRAGVRTGIIPPQCSGVFQRFVQEHLLPTESGQWHLDQMGLADQMRRRHSHLYRSSDENPVTWSSKSVTAEDARLDSELRELILYANEHAELLSVLTVNRKKAMTTAIRAATRNARVLMAFHAMTSIALDFYVDAAKKLQHQREETERGGKTNDHRSQRLSRIATLDTAHQTTFLEWLLLLEELAGLLCAGLHELDAMYYTDIARQFRSLILDLPLFLRKTQRLGTHSRQQALMLFLDNLHRLLKRATNRNELRVVAANGSGIVDQTKGIRARLRDLDVPISTSLGTLLENPHGMENLSRALVAMQYMWRRIMGTTALEKAMTSSKESISLLKKITEKLVKFLHILQRPMMVFQGGFNSQRQTEEFDSPSAVLNRPQTVDSVITDQSQSSNGRDAVALPGKNPELLLSRFPFTSSELLLDHFGWECLGAKRVKQLVKHASVATEVLRSAFDADQETVERMSVLELAEHFHRLEGAKTLFDVLDQLRQLPLDDELSFSHVPCVAHDRMEMSLWRLMVRPIQRVRLFHLHQQIQRFVASDYGKRQILLNRYRLASPQRPAMASASRDQFDIQGANATKFGTKSRESSACTRICTMSFQKEQRIVADRSVHKPPVPPTPVDGPSTSSPSPKVIISESTLKVCDGILSPDPFSDDAAMILLRRKLEAQKRRRSSSLVRVWQTGSSRSAMYRNDRREGGLVDRVFRWFVSLGARLMLLIAFWRQEELRTDLQDPIMARAFDDSPERDEYYRLYHAKKGLGELVRVWMPTSGRLGLLLWQERYYALGGTMLSIAIALWLPSLVFPASDTDAASSNASSRNTVMTRIVYTYGVGIFLLSVVSIVRIARNRFVLLEQTRLRLRPVSRYYQNVLAVISIAVELVQLNSLAFDSAVEWDDTDQLPAVLQWLGNQGITKFGVSSVSELQALGVLLLLLLWFLLLKCANKFQETSALLHRVLTKDLPALVHGFLYMGTISVFFSYLACMDCADTHSSSFSKCQSEPQTPPFLIAHQNVKCWTAAHRSYAFLGMWGITFFLPIGLLAHGMSHVLFQRETLDIKYAPVLLLVAQLVKAGAATAQAFFPYNPKLLAILGVIGNGVLLVLTLAMRSCSLWYIKYVKCSIYAASCWASLGAIHRLHYAGQSSTRSLNMIYFGWLSIGLVTAAAILLRVWLRAQAKYKDAERHFAAQQRLLSAGKSTGEINAVELKFLKAAQRHSRDDLVRAAFIENAKKLNTSNPPPTLKEFVTKAGEPLEGSSAFDSVRGAQFMRSAQVSAKKLQTLRRRR